MNSLITKKCNQCGLIKNANEFYENKAYKYGLRTPCKKCISEKNILKNNLLILRRIIAKPICARKGCRNQISKFKRKYCSNECQYEILKKVSRKQWEKQKNDPEYKKYHSQKAMEYQRRQEALGNCIVCGKQATVDLKEMPMRYCETHRIQHAIRNKNRYFLEHPYSVYEKAIIKKLREIYDK